MIHQLGRNEVLPRSDIILGWELIAFIDLIMIKHYVPSILDHTQIIKHESSNS